jgi:hypothetical protein
MNAAIQPTLFCFLLHISFFILKRRKLLSSSNNEFPFLHSPKLRYRYLINNIAPEDTVLSQLNPLPKFINYFSNIPLDVICQPKLKSSHNSFSFTIIIKILYAILLYPLRPTSYVSSISGHP